MKKILLFILIFTFSMKLNAACNYSDIKERNILSSYVDYNYEFNDITKTFSITIYNLKGNLRAKYNNQILSINNSESKIENVSGGTKIKVSIISEDDCSKETFRIINVNIPYLNKYYNSKECVGHESLNVCSSKYLDYELSENTFKSLISKDNKKEKIQEENNNEEIKKETLIEKIVNFLKEIYIPFILVIIGSLISILVFSPMYRKTKHGI